VFLLMTAAVSIFQFHDGPVEAFAAGDAERVASLSRQHCEHTLARLLAGLRRGDTGRDQSVIGSSR
jgi:DNA-binding GntR family transcriptional regulator